MRRASLIFPHLAGTLLSFLLSGIVELDRLSTAARIAVKKYP